MPTPASKAITAPAAVTDGHALAEEPPHDLFRDKVTYPRIEPTGGNGPQPEIKEKTYKQDVPPFARLGTSHGIIAMISHETRLKNELSTTSALRDAVRSTR